MDQSAARSAAELLEAFGRLVSQRSFRASLNPAQWAALRYFGRANASARTVTAFARAHAATSGTSAQTIDALVRKGCLVRLPMPGDRRQRRLDLTEKGAELLRSDPLQELAAAIATLSEGDQTKLIDALVAVAQKVQLPLD